MRLRLTIIFLGLAIGLGARSIENWIRRLRRPRPAKKAPQRPQPAQPELKPPDESM